VNGADSCTSYQASEVSLGNYQDGLPAVSVLSPSVLTNLASGRSLTGQGLLLSSPGATNTGSVDVTLDAPSWLEYDWTGSGPQDPFGTAIFGQFRGHDKVIYWREVY
jgi:MSHA biogenesis protein MshQ